MPNDNLTSVVPLLRQAIEYSDIESSKKDKLLTKLSDGRINTMTYDDAAELLDAMNNAQAKLDRSILDTNDPDLISELTDMKRYINEMLFEAEMSALQAGAGDVDLVSQSQGPTKYNPKYLLDKLAGLAE